MSARKKSVAPKRAPTPRTARAKASVVPTASPLRVGERAITIVHVSAEVAPWGRVGELGDSVAALAQAQAASGRNVIVISPAYRGVIAEHPELVPVGDPFDLSMGDHSEVVSLLGEVDPDPRRPWLLFVDHRASYDRDGVYAGPDGPYPDNPERFALLAHAASAAVRRLVAGPVVLHAHDWHAALVPVLEHLVPASERHATVLTVHDAAFQGHVGPERLRALGLPGRLFTPDALEWYGRVNLLKGGASFAEQVVATSPAHVTELRTPAGGFGLDGLFRWRGASLTGVADGLDGAAWNPATDVAIASRFGPGTVADRAKNKQALQRAAKLPVRARTPLVLLPSPLTLRSGAALALESALLRTTDAQCVILAAGEPALVAAAQQVAAEHPGRIAVIEAADERTERRALAGADIVLLPSLHEPSAALARRALRYGAAIVVRATGAHGDLPDVQAVVRFQPFDVDALDRALEAALAAFIDKKSWTAHVQEALELPAGWESAVDAYDARYRAALGLEETP